MRLRGMVLVLMVVALGGCSTHRVVYEETGESTVITVEESVPWFGQSLSDGGAKATVKGEYDWELEVNQKVQSDQYGPIELMRMGAEMMQEMKE